MIFLDFLEFLLIFMKEFDYTFFIALCRSPSLHLLLSSSISFLLITLSFPLLLSRMMRKNFYSINSLSLFNHPLFPIFILFFFFHHPLSFPLLLLPFLFIAALSLSFTFFHECKRELCLLSHLYPPSLPLSFSYLE